MRILAVVPARGGSKSIPHKNLQRVGGVSLVARVADFAKSLDWIDLAILTTDSEQIADEGRSHGLEVPSLRAPELATDDATSADVWRDAWVQAEETFQDHFGVSILLEPTSPLRRSEDARRTVDALLSGDWRSAVTVSPTPSHYAPEKAMRIEPDGSVDFFAADGARHTIRQRLPRYYHRNGLCYAVRREPFLSGGEIVDSKCVGIVVDRPVANIDDPLELDFAEWLLDREREES